LIGRRVAATLRIRGVALATASLRDPKAAAQAAADCDTIINLAGESVAQRWSNKAKTQIRESRTIAVEQFFSALADMNAQPKHFISASAIGIYGTSKDAWFNEESRTGKDFLASVCIAWEAQAMRARELGMKVSVIRTGLVCATEGGALAQLLPIFRMGLGGRVGDGQQWYSWIHIDDVAGIYQHALDGVEGVLNATAPEPVRNEEFARELGSALHRPAALTIPTFAIEMRLGEGATIVLDGQRVMPTRTLETGYSFKYPTLSPALQALISSH
jgi:uncharacterized protein (TIGR01777 family)